LALNDASYHVRILEIMSYPLLRYSGLVFHLSSFWGSDHSRVDWHGHICFVAVAVSQLLVHASGTNYLRDCHICLSVQGLPIDSIHGTLANGV
jgi:hypothetical protein